MGVEAGTGSERVAGRFKPGNEVRRTLIVLSAMLKSRSNEQSDLSVV